MPKILLIEDDPFIVDIYKTKMKEVGFEVEIANDGEEGLNKMKEQKPDIVLLDIVLPNLDGWEFLKAMKNDAGLKDVKVIILSNLGQNKEVEKGLDLGAEKFIIKAHYTPSEVVAEIKKLLKS